MSRWITPFRVKDQQERSGLAFSIPIKLSETSLSSFRALTHLMMDVNESFLDGQRKSYARSAWWSRGGFDAGGGREGKEGRS